MPDKQPSSTPQPDTEPTVPVVCGVELPGFPRGFTLAELRLATEASDRHDLETLTHDVVQQSATSSAEGRNARLDAIREGIQALQKRLTSEYEREEWRDEKIAGIIDRLEKLQAQEAELITESAPENLRRNREQQEAYARVLEAQDRANLETVHAIAKHNGITVPKIEAWIEQAVDEDYEAAEDIVRAGRRSDPLERANRRQRRAAKRGRSNGSN